jgi:nucleotide-binding universal stress UspA family protein
MKFKDILAVVTSQAGDEHVIAFAEQLAKRNSARFCALVVRWKSALVITDAADQLKSETTVIKARFEREPGVAVESLLLEIDEARSAIGMRARHADVTIVGRPATATSDWDHALLEGALFRSGRPVIIVPPGWPPREIGRSVLVCWKPTREAARALGEAEHFLSQADRVTVVSVDDTASTGAGGVRMGADICAHLARRDVSADLVSLKSDGRSETRAILDQASAVDADLIVMGGYGRSRMTEFVFGGVTHEMLQTSNIPVLMAH